MRQANAARRVCMKLPKVDCSKIVDFSLDEAMKKLIAVLPVMFSLDAVAFVGQLDARIFFN